MEKRKALITGITGQDGSYLADLLIAEGYEIHGLVRRSSSINTWRIDHLYGYPNLVLHFGDLTDPLSLARLVRQVRPSEIYNLAAQSHVKVSFDIPSYTALVDGLGTLAFLEILRDADWPVRFYQASTSELYGAVAEIPQRETTPFRPRSPYACAKLFAYWALVNYREAYGLHASNGILFNHESPRRGETFVTRKITRAVARIYLGLQDRLVLGNPDARRDWGYAPEYVEGMRRMLQQPAGDDYVLATGETHSVAEFVQEAFRYVGLAWDQFVDYDERYRRPTEVDFLQGDPGKAKRVLGWEPRTRFKDLIQIMVDADLDRERRHT